MWSKIRLSHDVAPNWRNKKRRKLSEESLVRIRLAVMRGLIVALFVVLLGQLWKLQIVQGEQYRERAEHNRLRLMPVLGPRGVIYDRYGNLLARNIPSFTVSVVPAALPKVGKEQVFSRLSQLLNMPQDKIAELVGDRRAQEAPFTPVPIKTNVEQTTAFIVEEQHPSLPGVVLEIEPIRQYIEGPVMSAILGYVGRIQDTQYQSLQDKGYSVNDKLGQAGVEAVWESELRGTPGIEEYEVDSTERRVGTIQAANPVPGNNLVLSIDIDLQRKMTEVMKQTMGDSRYAVAVALNPQTGEVLGLVSLPSYDDNLFSSGISQADLDALLKDPSLPLVNHAISSLFPPGSIFKTVTGSAALQEGVATPSTLITCPGVTYIGSVYDPSVSYPLKCYAAHGTIDFIQAIALSCDTYFYYLGGGMKQKGYTQIDGLGIERLAKYARDFGLGAPTGIDLPGESQGIVPDDKWKRETIKEPWVIGDTYNMSIGQGFLTATPLQMANIVATVANGGTLYKPQVVREVVDRNGNVIRPFTKQVIRQVPVSRDNLEIIRRGMREAVQGTYGTAREAQVPGIVVAGKTGTAEFGQLDPKTGNYPTHGWFFGFAPYDNPQIAIVVFHELGRGNATAAPAAGQILKYYFEKQAAKQPEPK